MAVETERELELVVREEDGTTEIFMENTISEVCAQEQSRILKAENRIRGIMGLE